MMSQDAKLDRLALFFFLSILLFIPINSYADTIVPSVDGYMRDYPLDGNIDFSTTNGLLGQYVPDYQGYRDTEPVGLEDRGFVEFNIQGLIGSAYATLKLTEWYPLSVGNSDGNVDLYAYYGSNADGQIDQNDWDSGVFLGQITTTGTIGTVHTLNVMSFLTDALGANSNYLGFRIVDPTYSSENHFSYFISSSQVGSSAFGTTVEWDDQPMLITKPVPEPATMLLLSSGLIGLAGFRRKFKK